MIYRRFGRTELQMPVFSCGGMRYQHKWQDVPMDDVPPDNQANLEAKRARARHTIDNNGTLEQTRSAVRELYRSLTGTTELPFKRV